MASSWYVVECLTYLTWILRKLFGTINLGEQTLCFSKDLKTISLASVPRGLQRRRVHAHPLEGGGGGPWGTIQVLLYEHNQQSKKTKNTNPLERGAGDLEVQLVFQELKQCTKIVALLWKLSFWKGADQEDWQG